ncbi:MAG: rhomboid family intramembrane serine protease [Acidobacteriota bacterium]
MLKRQNTGSIVCPSCGRLVGVRDEECLGCGRRNPGMWGLAPMLNQLGRGFGFTDVVVVGCTGLFIITLLLRDPESIGGGLFSLLSPGRKALFLFGASGSLPIFEFGRWWTVLSAAWLHGGVLHIVMNMLWIRQLMPTLTEYFGVGRLVIIYTVSSIGGFGLTSFMALFNLPGPLHGANFTVGASAPLFGLFGALVLYGQVTGSRMLTRQVWQWVILFVVIGLLIPFIDNWAHLGGFAGGWLAARWLDPRQSESPQHLVAAAVCLAVTLLSILVSVLHGLQFLG